MEWSVIMTEKKDQGGVKYTLDVLQDEWQPRIIYWLGFRAFSVDELQRLLPELDTVTLNDELASLQNLRIVNPVSDQANKYSLTVAGEDLRNMVVTMSVWGRQQIDAAQNRASDQIVEPEFNASLDELLDYKDQLERYL